MGIHGDREMGALASPAACSAAEQRTAAEHAANLSLAKVAALAGFPSASAASLADKAEKNRQLGVGAELADRLAVWSAATELKAAANAARSWPVANGRMTITGHLVEYDQMESARAKAVAAAWGRLQAALDDDNNNAIQDAWMAVSGDMS